MCGIAGIFDPGRTQLRDLESCLRQMTAAVAHRGPDGEGLHFEREAGLGLGHRRLAIIDLSENGRQPMASSDGRFVISYNGEIYNYRDTRRELEALGRHFRGDSDTEVFLEACCQWGVEGALRKAAGMFALALWDRKDRRLYLIRDRMGIKPLYWARIGEIYYWASELTAIETVARGKMQIDPIAVAGVLRFGYVPDPLSIWREAKKLPLGAILTIDASGTAQEHTYWNLQAASAKGLSDPIRDERDAAEQLDATLRHVVAEHMVSDVPLGAFLSGGIDSSLITGVMQSVSPRPVKTFSIGFDVAAFDEAPYARAIAEHLGTEHTELYVSEQHALEIVPRLGQMFDEPFGDSSQVPTFLVSEMARKHVTVALTGDGGDEVFAGYSRYARYAALAQQFARMKPASGLVAALASALAPTADALGLDRTGWRIRRLSRYLNESDPSLLFRLMMSTPSDSLSDKANGAEAALRQLWPHIPGTLVGGSLDIGTMQLLDSLTYLPGDILTKVDRTSMAVSLETRVPFLDHRVVELGMRIPTAFSHNGTTGKLLLRKLLARHVPSTLFERPKMGFGIPLHAWLQGALRDWAESLLSRNNFHALGLADEKRIRRYWQRVQTGDPTFANLCWMVLSLCAWREAHAARNYGRSR